MMSILVGFLLVERAALSAPDLIEETGTSEKKGLSDSTMNGYDWSLMILYKVPRPFKPFNNFCDLDYY